MIARLTPLVSPKSSALTINRFARSVIVIRILRFLTRQKNVRQKNKRSHFSVLHFSVQSPFLAPRHSKENQPDADPEKHSDLADQRQRHAVIEIESGGLDERPGPRLVDPDERRDKGEGYVDRPVDRLEGASSEEIHAEHHQP